MTADRTPMRARETQEGILDALENYHSQTHAILQLLLLIGDHDDFRRLAGAVTLLHEALMERHNRASALITEAYAAQAGGSQP